MWGNIKMSYCSNKSKQFQWKFLHNAIFTEHRLNLMRMSNGLCNMCKDEERLFFIYALTVKLYNQSRLNLR